MTDQKDLPPTLPSLDGIDLRRVAGGITSEPEYLDYDIKGRGWWDRTVSSTGWGYLIGTGVGGIYGVKTGMSSVPNSRFKVKVNALLNHSGRYGSRVGNAVGCVALLYSLFEGASEKLDVEKYTYSIIGHSPLVTPMIGSIMSGIVYKSTAGPRVAALSGTIGMGTVGGYYAVCQVMGWKFANTNFMFL
uniref:Mitochondrial import inner membrane translocase subunit TIM23 n=1 Tax=Triparma pacifica TaxID=91992 RepID=A0A7S2QVE9_9STRA|mmetsp:Transcript_3/g.5  ORF Transcript_3/g.5 Transcript_3/m.5 type:complete len:189 (+) Transcript_3:132-698(+)